MLNKETILVNVNVVEIRKRSVFDFGLTEAQFRYLYSLVESHDPVSDLGTKTKDIVLARLGDVLDHLNGN
jgi:hypothetical protein